MCIYAVSSHERFSTSKASTDEKNVENRIVENHRFFRIVSPIIAEANRFGKGLPSPGFCIGCGMLKISASIPCVEGRHPIQKIALDNLIMRKYTYFIELIFIFKRKDFLSASF